MASVWALWRAEASHLLIFRHGEEQASVQLGVVMGQWLMPVVVDELHHRKKSKRFWESILPPAVKNLDQFVIASFPGINNTRLWSCCVPVRNSTLYSCILNKRYSSTPTQRITLLLDITQNAVWPEWALTWGSRCTPPALCLMRPAPGTYHQECLSSSHSPPL